MRTLGVLLLFAAAGLAALARPHHPHAHSARRGGALPPDGWLEEHAWWQTREGQVALDAAEGDGWDDA